MNFFFFLSLDLLVPISSTSNYKLKKKKKVSSTGKRPYNLIYTKKKLIYTKKKTHWYVDLMVKSNYHGEDAKGSHFSFLYKKKSGIKRKVFVVVISNVYNLKFVIGSLFWLKLLVFNEKGTAHQNSAEVFFIYYLLVLCCCYDTLNRTSYRFLFFC